MAVEAAVTRVGDLTARAATLDDAEFAADVWTAHDPDDPVDPLIQRYQWKTAPPWPRERFIFELDGRAVGQGFHAHAPWEQMPDRYGHLGAALLPDASTPERLDAIFELLESRLRAAGARTFATWLKDGDPTAAVLGSRGYKEERRGKGWELDLAVQRQKLTAMAEASRARMTKEGVTVRTLAEDDDPDVERKLHRLVSESFRDIPTTVPIVELPFEQWRKWLGKPGIVRDRVWIARLGDEVVGVSLLNYPPVRGNVWTEYTGTARSVRGRGVARALKLETVLQADALGIARVRTGNDAENAPILHLNEEMGYRQFGTGIQYLKPA
jgi:RimJ/RimL family protein N-acetyltransferase